MAYLDLAHDSRKVHKKSNENLRPPAPFSAEQILLKDYFLNNLKKMIFFYWIIVLKLSKHLKNLIFPFEGLFSYNSS